MLRWLFGKRDAAERGDDHVWTTPAARRRGIARLAATRAGEGWSVVVIARTRAACDEVSADLAAQAPALCLDPSGRSACRDALARAGSVTIAAASALPADVARSAAPRVDLLVVGRDVRSAGDDPLVRFADALGPRARITFHLTLEDPLLRGLGPRVGELLDRLGASDDDPIVHAFVTRAVAAAQRQ